MNNISKINNKLTTIFQQAIQTKQQRQLIAQTYWNIKKGRRSN